MNIAIIGCGWLGLPLAQKFLSEGHKVFGSTTRPEKISDLKKMGIDAFMYDGNEHRNIPIAACDVDCVLLNFPPSKSENYALQMENLLQQFSDSCKVIFTSSTSVYQEIEKELDETASVNKAHPVFLGEEMIRKSNKQNTILRLAGLIGIARHPAKYLSGRNVLDGNVRVNLIHLEDVLRAIETVINKNAWGKLYNICWPEHPKKAAYYTQVAQDLQIPVPIFELSDKIGKSINGDRIAKELDFQYVYSI